MRISKLFHWLYALLMLMPFAFFVPSVLYYAFNDNASMNSVEVPITETIAVDFNQYLSIPFASGDVITEDYSLTSDNTGTLTVNGSFTSRYVYYVVYNYPITGALNHKFYFKGMPNPTLNGVGSGIQLGSWYTATTQRIFTCTSDDISLQIWVDFTDTTLSYEHFTFQLFDLTKMFGVGNEPTLEEFNQMFPLDYYAYTESDLMQITYDTGETQTLVTNIDMINNAWESIWDLPLFNWSKVSFVTAPFSYLTAIFGIASTSSLNYAFTYFVTISIVWLVFDVLMYVPMLAHRWLDKARLE